MSARGAAAEAAWLNRARKSPASSGSAAWGGIGDRASAAHPLEDCASAAHTGRSGHEDSEATLIGHHPLGKPSARSPAAKTPRAKSPARSPRAKSPARSTAQSPAKTPAQSRSSAGSGGHGRGRSPSPSMAEHSRARTSGDVTVGAVASGGVTAGGASSRVVPSSTPGGSAGRGRGRSASPSVAERTHSWQIRKDRKMEAATVGPDFLLIV